MENKKKSISNLADERMQQTLEQAMLDALQSEEQRERLKKSSSSDEIPIEFLGSNVPVSEEVVFVPEQPLDLMGSVIDSQEPEVIWQPPLVQQQQHEQFLQKLEATERELGEVMEERDRLLKKLDATSYHHQLLEKRIAQTEENLRKAEQDHQNAEKERQQLYDRLLRLSADFDNQRKRSARERDEMRMYGHEGVMRDLVSILDNFDRALDSMKDAPESIRSGIEMVHKQFLDTLAQHGVVRFTSKGEPFDYSLHEALTVLESRDVPSNTVLEEFQAGYRFHERLLRPARVAVSKSVPPPHPVSEAASEDQQNGFSAISGESDTSGAAQGGGFSATSTDRNPENPETATHSSEPSATGGETELQQTTETPTIGTDLAADLAADLTVEFSDELAPSAAKER